MTYRACLVAMALALGGCQSPISKPKLNFNPFSWASTAKTSQPEPTPVPNSSQKAELQMSMGRSMEREGRLEEAITVYEDVLKKDKHRSEAYQRLAVVNDQLGNFDESDKFYAKGLKRDPKNAELLCDRGYSFYLQNRDKEAEQTLRQALKLNPRLARAHNNLALVLAHSGRNDESLAEFSQAGCPEGDARVNLAFCMMARREWTTARQELQRAVAADPNLPSVKHGLAYLRAKAPPEVAETVPVIPVSKPAIVASPSAIVNTPTAAPPAATAATLTSYEISQSTAATMPSAPAPTAASSELMTLSELMFLAPVPQREKPVLNVAELTAKPEAVAPQPATRPTPPPPRVVKLVIPNSQPSKPAVQPLPISAPTADDGLASFYPQPKSEIRIVERTQRAGTVK